jgi:hypothetical protein
MYVTWVTRPRIEKDTFWCFFYFKTFSLNIIKPRINCKNRECLGVSQRIISYF